MTPLWKWSALDIRRAVADRTVSPAELAQAANARIAAVDPKVRAFVNACPHRGRRVRRARDSPESILSA